MSNEPTEADDDAEDDPIMTQSIWKEFGIEFHFAPEELTPPVNHEYLRAFVAEELTGDAKDEVQHLIGAFKSWYEAWQAESRDGLWTPGLIMAS